MNNLKGSCACGQVEYLVQGKIHDCCICHCSICKKLSGTSGGAYGAVDQKKFQWVSGKDRTQIFKPTPRTERYLCSNCGSLLLTTHVAEPENVFISLGTLDSKLNQKIEYRQYSIQRPDWSLCESQIKDYPEWAE